VLFRSRVDAGLIVPGFEIRTGKGDRRWSISPQQVKEIGGMFGKELTETKPCTPKQAEVRGVPKEVVAGQVYRPDTAAKLKRIDPNKARNAFND